MSNFERERKDYFERLITKAELITSLAMKNDDNIRTTLRILIDPRDERELKVATCTLDVMEDLSDFIKSAAYGDVEYVPAEENEGLKTFVRIMKELTSGEELTDETITISGEPNAKMMFGLILGFVCEQEESMKYIAEEMGFSPKSNRLQELIEVGIKKILALQPNQNPNKELTDESVDECVAFSRKFHNLCKKYIKKEDNTDSSEYTLLRDKKINWLF